MALVSLSAAEIWRCRYGVLLYYFSLQHNMLFNQVVMRIVYKMDNVPGSVFLAI